LPNVGPYIYDVSISGFTRTPYIYDISSLRVNIIKWQVKFNPVAEGLSSKKVEMLHELAWGMYTAAVARSQGVFVSMIHCIKKSEGKTWGSIGYNASSDHMLEALARSS